MLLLRIIRNQLQLINNHFDEEQLKTGDVSQTDIHVSHALDIILFSVKLKI